MRNGALAAATALLLGACTVSVKGPEQPAGPMGEPVVIELRDGAGRSGELLAVTDADLVLKEANGTLSAVALAALKQVRLERYDLTVDEQWRDNLQLHSRYPQGLDDAQWQQLLRDAGQPALVRIAP